MRLLTMLSSDNLPRNRLEQAAFLAQMLLS